jgi:hypothetical protein
MNRFIVSRLPFPQFVLADSDRMRGVRTVLNDGRLYLELARLFDEYDDFGGIDLIFLGQCEWACLQ